MAMAAKGLGNNALRSVSLRKFAPRVATGLATISFAALGVPIGGLTFATGALAACTTTATALCTGVDSNGASINTTVYTTLTMDNATTGSSGDTISVNLFGNADNNDFAFIMTNPSSIITGVDGHGLTVFSTAGNSIQNYGSSGTPVAGQISAIGGNAINILQAQGGTVNMVLGASSIITANGTSDLLGAPTKGGGIVIASTSGSTNWNVTTNGLIDTQNDAIYMGHVAGGGQMTVTNNGNIGREVDAIGDRGVVMVGVAASNTATVTNSDTGEIWTTNNGVDIAVGGWATVNNNGGLIDTTAGTGTGVSIISGGNAEVNNSGHIESGGKGIDVVTLANGYISNSGQSVVSVGDAITVDALLTANVENSGVVTSSAGNGIGAYAVGDVYVGHGGSENAVITANNGWGITAISAMGDVTVGGLEQTPGQGDYTNGSIESAGTGITAVALTGSARVFSGDITSGSAPGGSPLLPGFFTGGVVAFGGGGDATVYVDGRIKTTGNFGALAISNSGTAAVFVNNVIDPPALVGAGSVAVGPGSAVVNVNALTEGVAVGVFGGSFGDGGNVNIGVWDNFDSVNPDLNGRVRSDGTGIMAIKAGDGDVNINSAGAIEGLTAAATGGDGINVSAGGGDGNIYVNTYNNLDQLYGHAGTINAGDDGIEISRLSGDGDIALALAADIDAGRQGVNINRALSQGGTSVYVGLEDFTLRTSPMEINSVGTGISINNLITSGSTFVGVYDGSKVISAHGDGVAIGNLGDGNIRVYNGTGSEIQAVNGSAVQVVSTSLGLGDNNVNVDNYGTLIGKGGLLSATIMVGNDDEFTVDNRAGAEITTASGAWNGNIIEGLSGETITVNNEGLMTGNVLLASLTESVYVNNKIGSAGVWNTSGYNAITAAQSGLIVNEGDGTNEAQINTSGVTIFDFTAPGYTAVLNTGAINVNGLALFTGIDEFVNYDIANSNLDGGLLNMQNGSSDLGYINMPNGDGIGDTTIVTGAFLGGEGSQLAVDAYLGAYGSSSSDLLGVARVASGTTQVLVNDTNTGLGSYNPEGIVVVSVASGDTQLGDFELANGPIDKGLYTYDLFLNRNHENALPFFPDTASWVLASYADESVYNLASLPGIAGTTFNATTDGWIDRSGDLRNYEGGDKKTGAWARIFGLEGERTGSVEIEPHQDQFVTLDTGYTEQMMGVQGGIDFTVPGPNGDFVVGALAGYTSNDVSFNSGDSAKLTGPSVGIYANWLSGGTYVDALLKADFLDVAYNIGGMASGNTAGTTYGGVIEVGHRMDLGNSVFVEPVANLAMSTTSIDSITVGSDTVSFDGDSLRGKVGGRIGMSLDMNGVTVAPYLTGYIGSEFSGNSSVYVSTMGSDTAVDFSGAFGEVGLGVNIDDANGSGFTGFLSGNVLISDAYTAGIAKAGLRGNF